ncbi:hypothetical protein [Picosynechococcus sp. NKBG15041c]
MLRLLKRQLGKFSKSQIEQIQGVPVRRC